ncbi:MAG TPA: SIMPL domain-containing protein [Novosphingobium sp.]|nr:SIMPL domain-containing protein [Novosphingobium sp.]
MPFAPLPATAAIAFIAAALIGTPALAAAPAELPAGHTLLTLSAQGQSARQPDIAGFSAGVATAGRNAAEAMAANAAAMSRLIAALKAAGIEPRDIQTSRLALTPTYAERRPGDTRAPAITGYQAANTVAVRERHVAEAGRVIDALVAAGANDISGPDFTLADPKAAEDEARADAIAQLLARARLYAQAVGLKVAQVRAISEFVPSQPMPMARSMALMAMPAAATPVEAGEVESQIRVTMEFDLGPA